MDILSINFALFVIQLAFCIIPIALGIRLFTLSSEKKDDIREKLSKKLLGDASLITPGFYNYLIYTIASFSLVIGFAFTLFVIFVIMPK